MSSDQRSNKRARLLTSDDAKTSQRSTHEKQKQYLDVLRSDLLDISSQKSYRSVFFGHI